MSVDILSLPQTGRGGHPGPGDGPPSTCSRLLNVLLRLLPSRRQLASAATVREQVRKLALRPASHEPVGLGRDIQVRRRELEGWPVYDLASATHPGTGHRVVFLHGGGYVKEITRAHWRFMAFLIRQAGVRCIVPIYPLAPRATAREVVPVMGELLRQLLEEAGPAPLTLMGNSAGAGLALAATQWLRDGGHRQPRALVLISPGVNAVVGRPEQVRIAAQDPLQDIPGMAELGRIWAGDLDASHPYASPLNGSFRDLPPLLALSGTADLLYPDSIELVAKARAAGVLAKLHLRAGQPHNYVALPTPEGRQARALILRVLSG